jgi:Raf kinase inhibitor-like YbhB/YbcL family protein
VRLGLTALLGVTVLAACGNGGSGTKLERGAAAEGFRFTTESAVAEGQPVAARFSCDGEDVSPALGWRGVPQGARELALALEDPDAPGATFTHWLVYDLDPAARSLPEDLPSSGEPAVRPALRQGENDFDRIGYGGPCPPEGEEHRYVFRLLALDAPVDLAPGADRGAFDHALASHVLAEARLTARYRRP